MIKDIIEHGLHATNHFKERQRKRGIPFPTSELLATGWLIATNYKGYVIECPFTEKYYVRYVITKDKRVLTAYKVRKEY
jgi:hypothetical protein